MAETPSRAAGLGSGRRRAGRRASRAIRNLRAAALLGLMIAAIGAVAFVLHTPPRVDPRRAYADAANAFRMGNYSAARNHARAALGVRPGFGAAHLLLARAYLQLGDGLAAEAELNRAVQAGLSAGSLHGFRAQARFLQGDADGAADEAAKARGDDPVALRARARALGVRGDNDQAAALLAELLARRPGDADAWADLGRLRLAAGDLGGATTAAARAVAAAHGDPIALTLQGEVVRARYGPIVALPWFDAALRRDAYFHPALIEQAATLAETGHNTAALAAARRALAARPGSPQALYIQATIAARAGRYDLARALLDRTRGQVGDLPGAMLLNGALAFSGGKNEVAIRDWRALLAIQPMNLRVRRLLATALLVSGDANGALETIRPIAVRDDADGYALTLGARAFEAIGDRIAAARLLDRAAAAGRAPSGVFAPDQSVAALMADAAEAPGDPTYVIGIIRGQLAAGDTAGAIARARGLATTSPGSAAAQVALGDALLLSGRGNDVIEPYRRAGDLSFDEPTLLRLVDAQGRAGKRGEAAATLALYLGQNPQSVAARRLLGHWQVGGADPAQAVETLEGVRRAVGDRDAALLADLALAYAASGDGSIARRYGAAAYALSPMNAAATDAYGVALAAAGDVPAARQLLAKATTLDPADPAIAAHARQIGR